MEEVALSTARGPTRGGNAVHGRVFDRVVAGTQLARLGIGHDLGPDLLGLADEEVVAVAEDHLFPFLIESPTVTYF